jgi:hypothetical protein
VSTGASLRVIVDAGPFTAVAVMWDDVAVVVPGKQADGGPLAGDEEHPFVITPSLGTVVANVAAPINEIDAVSLEAGAVASSGTMLDTGTAGYLKDAVGYAKPLGVPSAVAEDGSLVVLVHDHNFYELDRAMVATARALGLPLVVKFTQST